MSATIDMALALIGKRGSLRTPDIASELGLDENAVEWMLAPARADGRLVACNVEVGGRQVVEYRCSAGRDPRSRSTTHLRKPNSALSACVKPIYETERTYRAPNKPVRRAHLTQPDLPPLFDRVAALATIDAEQREAVTVSSLPERIKAVFKEHGPMTTRQLKAHIDDPRLAWYCWTLAESAQLGRLGGTKGKTIYGLPDQQAPEQTADAPPQHVHKAKKKRAGGGVRCNAA